MLECPDCGATRDETLVHGFSCQHERCPMLDPVECPITGFECIACDFGACILQWGFVGVKK